MKRHVMLKDRMADIVALAVQGAVAIVGVGGWIAIIYVAWHFIAKYW